MASREADLRRSAQTAIAPSITEFTAVSGSRADGTATLALNATATYSAGDVVVVTGVTPDGYNGTHTLTSVAGTAIYFPYSVDPGAWVSGGAVTGRVQLGHVDVTEANKNFFGSLATKPYALVLPAKNSNWNGQLRHFEILIPIRLWFGSTGDANNDFTAIEDTWTEVRDALKDEASWTRSPPDEMSIIGPDCRTDIKPMVFMYDFELTFPA
jgi:hypothetical protein